MLKKSVGLGTFPFSNVFSKVEKKEMERIVFRFLDLGGEYIESALIYEGVNELLSGILSKVPRESFYLSTKCVTTMGEDGKKFRTGKYDAIIEQCDRQLKDLKMEYIDLLMVHFPPTDAPFTETLSALTDLKEMGKIKDIGISNVNISQLREFNSTGMIQYIQNRFSLLHQNSFTDEMNLYCKENGIKYIPFQVIERGQLTNNLTLRSNMRDGDLRIDKPEFANGPGYVITEWSKTHIIPLAKELGTSAEALSIWWVLQQPNVHICSVGATSDEQIESNMEAILKSFPADTLKKINSAYADLQQGIQLLFKQSLPQFRGLS